MAEKLKDIYTKEFLTTFGSSVSEYVDGFNTSLFVEEIFSGSWEGLSIRERMKKIALVLGQNLSPNYLENLPILLELHEKYRGFNYLFIPDFVRLYGFEKKYLTDSLNSLKALTVYSSAEFAIRDFIIEYPDKVLPYLLEWSTSENEHIRRLSSEGSRPRLPWGRQIPFLVEDPSSILPILENLKADPSLYVRKSVANNLNDISKDHPSFVLDLTETWKGTDEKTDWILKKACRTLIKKADPRALALFGYLQADSPVTVTNAKIDFSITEIERGATAVFRYRVSLSAPEPVTVRLEYAIDYLKSNGQHSRKIFFLKEQKLSQDSTISGTKKQSFKEMTTRKHYLGAHHISLLVNGQEEATSQFELI